MIRPRSSREWYVPLSSVSAQFWPIAQIRPPLSRYSASASWSSAKKPLVLKLALSPVKTTIARYWCRSRTLGKAVVKPYTS